MKQEASASPSPLLRLPRSPTGLTPGPGVHMGSLCFAGLSEDILQTKLRACFLRQSEAGGEFSGVTVLEERLLSGLLC